jgi:hypothetical protein
MSQEDVEVVRRGFDEMKRVGISNVNLPCSGIETDIAGGSGFDFRDGKIVRWEGFGSKEKALDAHARFRQTLARVRRNEGVSKFAQR